VASIVRVCLLGCFFFTCGWFPGRHDSKLHGKFKLFDSENWSNYEMCKVEVFNFNNKWETWMWLATGMLVETWREWRTRRRKKNPYNFYKRHVALTLCLLPIKFIFVHRPISLNVMYIHASVCVCFVKLASITVTKARTVLDLWNTRIEGSNLARSLMYRVIQKEVHTSKNLFYKNYWR
jgi:hypothetical protein